MMLIVFPLITINVSFRGPGWGLSGIQQHAILGGLEVLPRNILVIIRSSQKLILAQSDSRDYNIIIHCAIGYMIIARSTSKQYHYYCSNLTASWHELYTS